MRHQKARGKLSRPSDQRRALLRSIVRALFLYGKIETTLTRAKAAKRLADKLVSISKKNDLFARRKTESFFGERGVVSHIFKTFPERFEGRVGGFTRIVKTRSRRGDAAPMAILELL